MDDRHAEAAPHHGGGQVGRVGEVEGVVDVGHGQRLPGKHHRPDHALAVGDLEADHLPAEPDGVDDPVLAAALGSRQQGVGAAGQARRDLQGLLLQRGGALGGRGQRFGDLSQ